MDTVWERLTSPRRGPPGTPSVIDPVPAPGDRHGVHLYADFTECLDDHKGHAFAGEGVTVAHGCMVAWRDGGRCGYLPLLCEALGQFLGRTRTINQHILTLVLPLL